jgi:proteic killer suppression protein
MDVRFKNPELDRLETDATFTAGFAAAVVKAFRKVMQAIRSATDERTFYAMKSLHFEKLQGKRAHQRSMRLNDQYRLIVEFETGEKGKVVVVVSIEDYH